MLTQDPLHIAKSERLKSPDQVQSRWMGYCIALAGPVGTSAAHFLVMFVSLRNLSAEAFGTVSLILIFAQFTWSVWSALFSAPLPVLLQANDGHFTARPIASLVAASLVGAGLAAVLYFVLGKALGLPSDASVLLAIFGFFSLCRWFGRSYCYALGRLRHVLLSDLLYCSALLVGIGWIWWESVADPWFIYVTLAVGAVFGLAPIALILARSAHRPRMRMLGDYRTVWRTHAWWSLRGAFTMEVTANSHTYLITMIYGPAAFSIVAATSLMSRPVGVIMNGLSEFERVRLARMTGLHSRKTVFKSAWSFRLLLLASWGATVAAASAILVYNPALIFPTSYERSLIVVGSVLWLLVVAARASRTTESVLMEATGQFRSLARASVISGIVSVGSVLLLAGYAGVIWSIAGVILGEIVYALCIWKALAAWLRADPMTNGPRRKKAES